VNFTGLAISQTTQRHAKLPIGSASLSLRPASSSARVELSAFLTLLNGLIYRKTGALPVAPTPVTMKVSKSEKQPTEPSGQTIAPEHLVLLDVRQFRQIVSQSDCSRDETSTPKQPIPASGQRPAVALHETPSRGTIDPRSATPDIAFGVRLTKNQPVAENPGLVASESFDTDLSHAPNGSFAAQSRPDLNTGGVASPSTPPHPEVAEVLAADNGAISQDPQPKIRPEAVQARTTAPELPSTLQKQNTGGKDADHAEPDQRGPAPRTAPRANQAAVRNDGHPPADSGTGDVSAKQYEMARTAEPQTNRDATSPNDARKVVSDPERSSPLQPQPARNISLKLTGPDSARVDLQLTERAGRMQIAVRTPDHALAKSMQTDLSELVGRLENRGFKAEAWIPASGRHTEAAGALHQSSQADGQNQPERHSGGSGSGPQHQRHDRNESNPRQQARWKAQLEETTSEEETRMENI
jgi:hypothetical protein